MLTRYEDTDVDIACYQSLATNFVPRPIKIAPANRSIHILFFRYRLRKRSKEKTYATDVYQKSDIENIRVTLMSPVQRGAFEGMVAANKLVTKAAVFGFDRLVKSPNL